MPTIGKVTKERLIAAGITNTVRARARATCPERLAQYAYVIRAPLSRPRLFAARAVCPRARSRH